MKFIPFLLMLLMAIPSYGGGVSRSRAKVVNSYHNANQVVIEQKVIEYGDSLQIIAVPVTDVGLQYYYQSEPLRGRGLTQEDRDQIVQEVVKGVLAGIDERFEIANPDGSVTPPKEPTPTPTPPESATPGLTELDKKVFDIMTGRGSCAICHTEGSLEKANMPVLLTKDGSLSKLTDSTSEQLRRWKIWDSVFEGRMPKNNGVLSDNDTKVFKDWIKEVK